MPFGVVYFSDPVEFTGDDGSVWTLNLTPGAGRTVLGAGGDPVIWDQIGDDLFAWVNTPRSMSFAVVSGDPATVVVTASRYGMITPYLKNAWISYWEED